MMDILLLTTPMQHSVKNPGVELNVKRLKEWVDQLPVVEVIETVNLLQNAIESFNEVKIDNISRLKLLEVYWEALESVIFLYDSKRLDMLPINQQAKDLLAEDIMWLYLALAKGYKIILLNNANLKTNPKNDLALQLSVFRAMELLIQSAMYAFCSHKSAPPLVFLEINQVYFYMELHQCLNLKIKTRQSLSTVNDLYKQFMFIALIDPYRFTADDIFQVQLIMHNFSKYIKVEKDGDCLQSEGKFIVDLNEDLLPIYSGRVNNDIKLTTIRLININPALKAMFLWVGGKKNKKVNSIEKNDIQFIKQFLDSVGYERTRKENRQTVKKQVRVAIGLKSVSYFLQSIDNILQAYAEDDYSNEEESDYILHQWTVNDECNHGRKLSISSDNLFSSIKMGELIGIIDTLKSDSGFHPVIIIGIVRWERKVNSSLNYGLEIIPGIPRPANKILSKNTNEQYSGIYFPAEDILSRPPALVIEKYAYQNKKQLDITIKNKTQIIQMGGIFTESPLYVQCEFSNVNECF